MSLILSGIRRSVADEIHLHPMDAEFQAGLNVLAGPTLSGKTSLLRIIAGLDRPDGGKLLVHGKDISRLSVQQRRVAIVYQQYINYPNFSVYDNIASPLRLAKYSTGEIDKKVREAAELLQIAPYLQRLPSELSGGQQQRTAIARALVKDTDIILLDEPLVNLDYKLREQLRREMRILFAEEKRVAIYATTEPVEAALLGDNLLVLDEGKILQAGPGEQVFQEPHNLRVAEILSDPKINSLVGTVEEGLVTLAESIQFPLAGALANIDNQKICFGLRPHHIDLRSVESKENQNAAWVRFAAVVDIAEVSGSETLIHTQVGNQPWIVQQAGVHQYSSGDQIVLAFDPQNLLLFNLEGQRIDRKLTEGRRSNG